MMRRGWAFAVVAFLFASTACTSYRVAPIPAPLGAAVRVSFNAPRAVDVTDRDGDPGRPMRIDGVTTIEGRVLATRGDSLDLAITAMRAGRRRLTSVSGASRATVVPDARRPVEQRRTDRVRTVLLSVGMSAAIVLAAALYGMSDPNY
jgi:hypothetical protein